MARIPFKDAFKSIVNQFAHSGRVVCEDGTAVNVGDAIDQMSGVGNILTVAPSDTVDLAHATTGLYVGVEGDVKLTTIGGQTVIIRNLAAGVWHPIKATRIFTTGTTATDIMGAW